MSSKKVSIIVATAVLSLASAVSASAQQEQKNVTGDVNLDGVVNDTDITLLRDYILSRNDGSGISLDAADANADGLINVLDLQYVQNIVSGDGKGEKLPDEGDDDWIIGDNK
jgi:cell division protein FtsX